MIRLCCEWLSGAKNKSTSAADGDFALDEIDEFGTLVRRRRGDEFGFVS
jgi:hypothetical protein